MSNEFEKFIRNNRQSFDDQAPDPAVLERIQHQMASKPVKNGVFISAQALRWAAACLLLMGAATFLIVQKEPSNNITKTQQKTDPVPSGFKIPEETPKQDLLEKQTEVTPQVQQQYVNNKEPVRIINRRVMFANLTNNESAGERIIGAGQAYNMQKTDKDIVDVLIKTMNADPNTNVRLAALDALSRFNQESYVKQQLIASLKIQKDPMVQIGLIQLLTGMKETAILNDLEKIVNDNSTLKAVQDEAYSSIFQLKSS